MNEKMAYEFLEQKILDLESANRQLKREIAERNRVECKLKRFNAELDEKFKERCIELDKAYHVLQDLDKMKDDLLATVSHELRTPLTSIRSFSEILLRFDDDDSETRQEFLKIINTESERLTSLIEDVLDLSKIEAKKMVWYNTQLSLETLFNEVADTHHKVLSEKSLKLTLDISPDLPHLFLDRDRIYQVITNLLDNAIKFSFERTEICIRAEKLKGRRSGEHPDWIKVSVSDQGVGIPQKDFFFYPVKPLKFIPFLLSTDDSESNSIASYKSRVKYSLIGLIAAVLLNIILNIIV